MIRLAELLFADAVGTERTCTLFACAFKTAHKHITKWLQELLYIVYT